MTEAAPQRIRMASRCFVAYAADQLPPWALVYQQTQRWLSAGCFEAMVNDLRSLLRVAQERQGQPSAVILDGRTLQSTCESGPRAGYDGYKRKRGSKVHMAADTLGHLLAVHITPANEQERAQVVERSFGWLNRFRRLARDYERLPETLAGLHFVVFAMLMLVHAVPIIKST